MLSASVVGYRSEVVGDGRSVVIAFSSLARKFDLFLSLKFDLFLSLKSVLVVGDRLVVVCLIVRIIDELAI